MAKAFDTVNHKVAASALTRGGTPKAIVGLLASAWSGPRYCHVAGDLSEQILPRRGLPPGCPTSGLILGTVLAPWAGLVGNAGWAYMDDRSIKTGSREEREAALHATARFDGAVGLSENAKKRQMWEGDCAVEHLGLRAQGNSEPVNLVLPQPRDGWQPTEEVIQRLALIPGPAAVREKLAVIFCRPRCIWAAPLIEPPSPALANALRRAVTRTRCSWWCSGRWWCDRISLHPVLGTAVQALKRAGRLTSSPSATLTACLQAHAEKLGLRVADFSVARGLWVRPKPSADPRARAAARAARRQDREEGRACGLPADAFRPDTAAGEHAARVCARAVVLASVRRSRHDAEGTEAIDIEAQSQPSWRRWERSLPPGQRTQLSVWRGGAVHTPTRRWYGRRTADDQSCPHCGFAQASARHFWAECPRFDAEQRRLERELGISPGWWANQPRCTAKTGWITSAAASSTERRASLQVAACRLGLTIVAATPTASQPCTDA